MGPISWRRGSRQTLSGNALSLPKASLKTLDHGPGFSLSEGAHSVLALGPLLLQSIRMTRTAFLLFALLASPLHADHHEGKITHSFLGLGKGARTSIVGEDGKVTWQIDLPASDGWVLPNGNVLAIAWEAKSGTCSPT